MVSKQEVTKQLKRIDFPIHGWGKSEIDELENVLLADEEVFECVNGAYENGFALLVATNFRVLLIDKKPLNFLNVEDMRFDMISEMDYSHRLFGAEIHISCGSKTLNFQSVNKPRLRKLIGHVQHSIADSKKKQSNHQEDQSQHLQDINDRLQTYLHAQQEYQEQVNRIQKAQQEGVKADLPKLPEVSKPSPELNDYLFAQSLLAQYKQESGASSELPDPSPLYDQAVNVTKNLMPLPPAPEPVEVAGSSVVAVDPVAMPAANIQEEIYEDAQKEIFGASNTRPVTDDQAPAKFDAMPLRAGSKAIATKSKSKTSVGSNHRPRNIRYSTLQQGTHEFEVNPMHIAYSKLPMALRNKKFGRPSFHAHSESAVLQKSVPEPIY